MSSMCLRVQQECMGLPSSLLEVIRLTEVFVFAGVRFLHESAGEFSKSSRNRQPPCSVFPRGTKPVASSHATES